MTGRPKELTNPVRRSINIELDDIAFLKSQGISLTSFIRQCIDKLRNGTITYDREA